MIHTGNTVYQYAVVRFMPFIETREFANVGVVLIAPKTGTMLFKLAPARFSRVTQFFDDLDGKLYKNALHLFRDELERVQQYCTEAQLRGKALTEYFKELTRLRESVLHFGYIGRLMGAQPEIVLDTLYQRFVARDFATHEYREEQMAKVLKQTLFEQLHVKYTKQTLKAGVFDISLPLVHRGNNYRTIKPLAFEQQTPLKAYEHSKNWLTRFGQLIKKEVLQPQNALFTVESPATGKSDFLQVYNDVLDEIKEIGVEVQHFSDTENIIRFAQTGLVENTHTTQSH